MDGTPFASLAQIRILLVPVGTIRRSVFEKYAGLVRSIEHIRLGDIPPDSRDDKNRFLPSPLSAGSIHLRYTTHPPSMWHNSLSLFRLSSFPLAVIGIADCSQKANLATLSAEFKATLGTLFSASIATPFATKCFAFEDGDALPDVNVGSSLADLVMIPSLMSNKQVYIGTLLAELCHSVLSEFPAIVRAVDNPEGLDALAHSLLPSLSKYNDGITYFVHGAHRPANGMRHSAPNSVGTPPHDKTSRSSTPGPTNGFTSSGSSGLLNISTSSKKRASTMGPQNGRLAKIVGDLYLLAGKLSDASYWYSEAISLFRTQQDSIWNASALEGQSVVEMLEAWSLGESLHTSLGGNVLGDPWANISDKMSQAINLYSRATPMNAAPPGIPDPELATIVFLFTEGVLRFGRLLFAIWSGKGWNPLSLSTMFSTALPPSFSPDPPGTTTLFRLSAMTRLNRSHISGIISQAHGPFLLHLQPSDRVQVLSSLASLYSCLGFKRKEAYVLREVQAALMDLIVCNREESRNSAKSPLRGNIPDPSSPSPSSSLSIRQSESSQGNTSVIRMARYVAQVYGVDLGQVTIGDAGNKRMSALRGLGAMEALPPTQPGDARYGWPELQVGVVREALAIAESLPDHFAVAQFSLSTLRALHPYITGQEQQHLAGSANRAVSLARRRGLFQSVASWFDEPLLSIELAPIPPSLLPSEHPRSELDPVTSQSASTRRVPFMIYDPRRATRTITMRLVQNESVDFTVTLQNPFLIDIDIPSILLSTAGVPFHSQSSSTSIPALSTRQVTLSGIPLEQGQLTIRGCSIQLQGAVPHEFVFSLPNTEPSNPRSSTPAARISYSLYDPERIKVSGLDANPILSLSKPSSDISSRASNPPPARPPKFLQYEVVREQPLLRVRRSSLTQSSLMLFDGEYSEIRLTIENISTVPVDFYKLTFDDSTIAPAQQLLSEGELSIAEAYETEYGLVHRPFFTWNAPNPLPPIAPGKRAVVPIRCHGKTGCLQGTVQISYSYVDRPKPSITDAESDADSTPLPSSSSDTFHARQILYPVNITVYHTLEFSNLDVIPLYAATHSSHLPGHGLTSSLLDIPTSERDHYCLVSVDVTNLYGLPFDVTLERKQEDLPAASITRVVAPGCTSKLLPNSLLSRLFLPLRRIMLDDSAISAPIPSLYNRQFVVSKDKLTEEAQRLQREMFWYREKLFELVMGHWSEARTVSLRSQRLTLPMRDALRKVAFPIDVSFGPADTQESSPTPVAVQRGNAWNVRAYEVLKMSALVRNEC
ncbi:hypothetical protein DL93DRAFT_2115414, partial [Clavulina sp. PMI_390]